MEIQWKSRFSHVELLHWIIVSPLDIHWIFSYPLDYPLENPVDNFRLHWIFHWNSMAVPLELHVRAYWLAAWLYRSNRYSSQPPATAGLHRACTCTFRSSRHTSHRAVLVHVHTHALLLIKPPSSTSNSPRHAATSRQCRATRYSLAGMYTAAALDVKHTRRASPLHACI